MNKIKSREEFERIKKRLKGDKKKEKRVISVCGSTGCSAFGSAEVIDAFETEIKKRGLTDKVAVKKTGCHGFCERGPIVVIAPEDFFYNRVAVEDGLAGRLRDQRPYQGPANATPHGPSECTRDARCGIDDSCVKAAGNQVAVQ